ncbi:LRR receptor-like serine/threonine-protein kinase ERL1 [Cornus florida]|uniref:LRR receptor-like serine/threonine-protein kinase ERL1 n=1 Tax=Cornus florida TaxID=4283 RepID=UPI00289D8D4B|nr:LRR receptor-like serine/threonine-protein kinase ERL1 [Cornus florida]
MASYKLGPQFPPWLQTQKHVETLVISNANISNIVPDWFRNLYSRINLLDISHNQICGKLPKFQESNVTVTQIFLNSKKFEGPLTPFLSHVTELDFSDNLLSSDFPLVDDNIYKSFMFLKLSNNNLTGDIPKYICEMRDLQILDLSKNKLSGTLPWCNGKLQELCVLDLKNNNLVGDIPSSLGSLTLLNSLHLRNNMLHGKIPSSLQNLKYLRILDLDISNNQIVGEIPEELMDLTGLLSFNASKSHLNGRIPKKIGNMKTLESPDLSRNKLSGSIPPSLSSCHGDTSSDIGHHDPHVPKSNDEEDESERLAFYTAIGPGFLVGFLAICGILHFKKSWRYAWFQFVENTYNNLLVAVIVKAGWVRRKFHKDEMGG